jgi:hypothetical protein
MSGIDLLRAATLGAAILSLGFLVFLVFRANVRGLRAFYSAPRGSAGRGVMYAFGRGMLPWEKESAGGHWPTFIGGILYHAAVFTAFFYLFWTILAPASAKPLRAFRLVFFIGAAAGLTLVIKRAVRPHLRRLSCPDDFFANLFVDLFLVLSFGHTCRPGVEPLLLLSAIALFLYLPLGKIRHCFFFFYTRILFGVFFGRRGVYPPRRLGPDHGSRA